MKLIRVGVDLAKNVFQVHGVDRNEKAVWRRKLTRENWLKVLLETVEPGCEIGMEVVRWRAPLGAPTAGAWIHGEVDRTAVREAVCEEQQERRQRCGGDLRSDEPAAYAVRSGEDGRATGHSGGTPHSCRVEQATHGQSAIRSVAWSPSTDWWRPRSWCTCAGHSVLAGGCGERLERALPAIAATGCGMISQALDERMAELDREIAADCAERPGRQAAAAAARCRADHCHRAGGDGRRWRSSLPTAGRWRQRSG